MRKIFHKGRNIYDDEIIAIFVRKCVLTLASFLFLKFAKIMDLRTISQGLSTVSSFQLCYISETHTSNDTFFKKIHSFLSEANLSNVGIIFTYLYCSVRFCLNRKQQIQLKCLNKFWLKKFIVVWFEKVLHGGILE